MQEKTRQKILDFLQVHDDGGATYADLMNGVGLRRPTLTRYIKALESDGLVERIIPKNRRHRDRFKLLLEHLSHDECHITDVTCHSQNSDM